MHFRKVALVCVGILVLLAVGIRIYFNADRLRTLIVPHLSAALKRSVALQDVGVGLWGGVHLSVVGLDVAERPGFGTKPFLRVETANIYVNFWPLLRGDVEIEKIDLVKPLVSIVVLENGDTNYSDLSQSSEKDAAGKSDFFIKDVVVVDGHIGYADLGKKIQMELDDIDYTLDMHRKENAWDLNGDLGIGRVGWQQDGQLDTLDTGVLHLVHRITLGLDVWHVMALDVTWAGLTLTASGQVRMVGDETYLDLSITEPGLDLGTTRLRDIAKLPVDVTGSASVDVKIAGPLNLDATPPRYPDVQGHLLLSAVKVLDGVQESRIDTAAAHLVGGVLQLVKMEGQAFGGHYSLAGQVAPLWPPGEDKRLSVTLNAQTDVFQLAESSKTTGEKPVDVSSFLAWLRSLDAQVLVDVGRFVMPDRVVQNAKVDARLREGQIQIVDLSGQVFGGTVRVAGKLDMRSVHQSYPVHLDVKAEHLHLKPMLSGDLDVDGQLGVDVRVNGILDGALSPILERDKLTLLGRASIDGGKLKTPELQVPVDSLVLSIEFLKDQVVQINKMAARAGESDLLVTGRIEGLWDYALNATTLVRPYAVAQIQSDVLDMDALFPAILPLEGDQTSGVLVGMRQADARVDVAIGSLVSDSTRYDDFRAIVTAKSSILQVDSIRAKTLGGVMQAQAEVDGRAQGPVPVRATASLMGIGAEQFLQGYMKWTIPMVGQLGVSLGLQGHMDSTLTLIEKTIRAEGEARLDEGRVVNWPWLQTTSAFVPHLQFLNFKDLPLKALAAPFKMNDGRVFLNQMGFRSGDVGFELLGSVGVDGTLDLAVDADVPASRLNISRLGLDRIAGLNLKPDAKIPLRIQIAGTSDKPKVEAKLQPEAQKALEDKSQEIKNKAKDKAKGLLKSLF